MRLHIVYTHIKGMIIIIYVDEDLILDSSYLFCIENISTNGINMDTKEIGSVLLYCGTKYEGEP